jgi:hypothetical protein
MAINMIDDSEVQAWVQGDTPTNAQRKVRLGPDGALFLESVNPEQPLLETSYCLEFLLVALSKSFNLKPKQAAVLMTRKGRYLAKVLCKGLRQQFEPIEKWLDVLIGNAAHLCGLMIKEKDNEAVSIVCDVLQPGLLSQSQAVVSKVVELLTYLAKASKLRSETWEWFKTEPTCIKSVIVAYGRYPELGEQLTTLIFSFSGDQLDIVLRELLTQCFSNKTDYVAFIVASYDYLMQLPNVRSDLTQGSLIEHLVSTCLSVFEGAEVAPLDVAELAAFLWAEFPNRLDEATSTAVLACLKKLLRDKRLPVRVRGVCLMFHLVDVFASQTHLSAPAIYKTLTTYYIEAYNALQIRQLMVANLPSFLARFESVPMIQLAEAVQSHLKLTKCLKVEVNDLDLVLAMARHPQLDAKTAVVVLNILGLVFTSAPIFAKACMGPMVTICTRYVQYPPVQDYLVRFCKLGVQQLSSGVNSKRSTSVRLSQVASVASSVTKSILPPGSSKDFSQDVGSSKTGLAVLDLTRDLFDLHVPTLSDKLQQALIEVDTLYKKRTGTDFPPVVQLLSKFGDPSTLAVLYSSLVIPSDVNSMQDSRSRPMKIRDDVKIARQKWLESAEEEKKRSEEEEMHRRRQQKLVQQKVELQKIKQGIPLPDDNKPLIFPLNSQTADTDPDVCEVSDEDQVALQQVLRRSRRVLQRLYKQYAYTRGREFASEKLLTEGQLWQLLKEQGVTTEMLTNDEFRRLIKKYCTRRKRPNSTLDFKAVVDFLVQVAAFVFSKGRFDLNDLPPAIAMTRLVEVFKSSFDARGESTAIFDDADSELVRTLNQRLGEDSESELPPSYMRGEEVRLEVAYAVPDFGLTEAQVSALEVIDEITSQVFSFHLLRPVVVVKPSFYAKRKPAKAAVMQGGSSIPLEFSQGLKQAIAEMMDSRQGGVIEVLEAASLQLEGEGLGVGRMDAASLGDLIEVGYVIHSMCERAVKEAKGAMRNRAVEVKTIEKTQQQREKDRVVERIQQRGRELKSKIEELKQVKAQTSEAEALQRQALQ